VIHTVLRMRHCVSKCAMLVRNGGFMVLDASDLPHTLRLFCLCNQLSKRDSFQYGSGIPVTGK
jgi:hypothetical protein